MRTSNHLKSLQSWMKDYISSAKEWLQKRWEYDLVVDAHPELAVPKSSRRTFLKAGLLISASTILLIELIFIFFTPNPRLQPVSGDIEELAGSYTFTNTSGIASCGFTQDEAIALGCRFDNLTISWEPPECYHADVVDEFWSVDDWQFYNDTDGTRIPPGVPLADGHRRWNVKWGFHVTHCVYTWKMMQKAVLQRRPLPDNLLDYDHTRHCMEMMLERRFPWEDLHTLVHVKWPKCVRCEEWDQASWVENLVLPS